MPTLNLWPLLFSGQKLIFQNWRAKFSYLYLKYVSFCDGKHRQTEGLECLLCNGDLKIVCLTKYCHFSTENICYQTWVYIICEVNYIVNYHLQVSI